MSITVHRKDLTDEQARYIANEMILTPKTKFIPGKKFGNEPPKSTPMFVKKGDNIHLPYTFAKGYLGIKPKDKFHVQGMEFKFQLRDNQIPKVEEALEHLHTYGTTVLQLDTAYGKTVIAIYLAVKLSKIVLVIHPGKTLHGQWIKAFGEATNLAPYVWDIYKKQPSNVCVIVSTTGMLSHIPDYIMDNIGTLIIDETHQMCAPTDIPTTLTITPQYIIGSSYTYEKSCGSHAFMDMMLGLRRVTGRLDMIIHAIRLNTTFTYEVPIDKRGITNYPALVNMLTVNEERNQFICQLVIANKHRKMIVLTPRVDHAEKLSIMLNDLGVKSDYITGKKQKYDNSNVLVGSIGKINTGFDEKNYCDTFDGIPSNLLINVGSNIEHNLIVQIVGRLKRSKDIEPYIIDVVDDCRIFIKHAKERKKIYVTEGYKYYEVNNQIVVLPEK